MPVVKLTDELKKEMKDFYKLCKKKILVAERFNVSIPTVYRILSEKEYIRDIKRSEKVKEGFFNVNENINWIV